jgi:hypothetical protein
MAQNNRGCIVTVGYYNICVSDNNGDTWRTFKSDYNLVDVIYVDEMKRFIALGYYGEIISSDDGKKWIEHRGKSEYGFSKIVYRNHMIMVKSRAGIIESGKFPG